MMIAMHARRTLALILATLPGSLFAQTAPNIPPMPQNPSPMVEHTREHPRLTKTTPPGRREKLELGTLFISEKLHSKTPKLFFFFHGGDWLPEYAAAQQKDTAVITVQSGAGSSNYTRLFTDPKRFLALITEAQSKSGLTFSEID